MDLVDIRQIATFPHVRNPEQVKPDNLMNVAVTTIYDAQDPGDFGGRGYYMSNCLRDYTSLSFIGPLSLERYRTLIKLKTKINRRIYKKRYSPLRDQRIVKSYAKQISDKLENVNADIILSPMSPGSQPVAYLESRQPIVIWTDTTLVEAIELYGPVGELNLCPESLRDGIENERNALTNADMVIYTSDYAANKAVEYYGLDPQKLRVATFGADIDIQPNPEEIAKMIQSRSRDRCRLLFLGTDWGRKGGQAALDIAQELHRRGLEIEFVVVASHVKDLPKPLPDFMQLTGYIKKHEEPGTSQWRQLLSRAHFLLLPTRADLTPLIISEAAAYGLPCLASHVGGISTIIKEDVNGHTFPLDNSVNTYCDYIADVFADRKRYEELALSSYQEYETRLNWSAVGRTVFGYLEEVLNG